MTERPIIFSAPMVRAIIDGRKTQTRRVVKPQPGYQGIASFCFERHPFAPSALDGTPAEGANVAPEKDVWVAEDWCKNIVGVLGDCPYGAPGDRLWVKETWGAHAHFDQTDWCADRLSENDRDRWAIAYRAGWGPNQAGCRWRPSIYLPRWASRLTLEVTDVRVERVQEISANDAVAEGFKKLSKDGGQTWKYGIADLDGLPGNDDVGWHWKDWSADPCFAFRCLWDSINAARGHGWESNPWAWAISFRVVEGRP